MDANERNGDCLAAFGLTPGDVLAIGRKMIHRYSSCPARLADDALGAFVVGAIRAARRADPTNPGGRGYVIKSGLHAAWLFLRREGRHAATVSLDEPADDSGDGRPLAETLPDPRAHEPGDPLIVASRNGALRRAMMELPERQREIVQWSVVFGESQREIAARLGISATRVGQLLAAALAELREIITQTAPEIVPERPS